MFFYKLTVIFLVALLSYEYTDAQKENKFFRKDYVYIDTTESFYKIHTIPKTWHDSKKICAMEGATLFYPEDKYEFDAVSKFWNSTQPFEWIRIGVSSLISKGVFETIDGIPFMDVYNNWSPGEPNDAGGNEDCVAVQKESGLMIDNLCDEKMPFMCKKTLASIEWNVECDIPNTDYQFSDLVGRCYKVHLTPTTWNEAYRICSAEQSYLAIIDNQAEADHLVNITDLAPKHTIKGNYLAGAVFLGYHNKNGEGWATVKRKPLETSGYTKWGYGQPDGGEREKCGSMFYNGHLNDISCTQICIFICEHEVASSFDERFDTDNEEEVV